MGVAIEIGPLGESQADARGVLVSQPVENVEPQLSELATTGELRGERGEAVLIHADGARLVAAGVGKRAEVDRDALRTAGAAAAHELARVGGTLAWQLDESLPLPLPEQAAAVVEGTILGGYTPGRWKTNDDGRPKQVDRIVLESDGVRDAAEQAVLLAERTNRARDLANMPPNELYPETLAQQASALADEHEHLTATALGPKEMEELGMGALLAVGAGSHNEPRLVVLRYEPPAARDGLVLGLVGKAITFDAGGISIKPAAGMDAMKGDMAGGAGTLHGIGAVAALGLPVRAIAVIAAAENLPSGHAFRPGDILTAANGKTIEIINTDAEGRLVLADALWYARREGATHVLDLATLTGAMEIALGDLYAGFFSNDDEWRDRIVAAGERSGDLVWPFPLHPRYRRYVDSAYADMKNGSTLRQASPALAAEFLQEFAGEGPWAHVDMAGPGFLDRSRGDYLRVPGGTGYGVRLIAELATSLA
ncbi:MAG: leucyl aminopeptidase family protein [Actinobacteria bacterium]|nr:MAG: leucyl aminopeptidase family protein [Actinomycetota bacterium]